METFIVILWFLIGFIGPLIIYKIEFGEVSYGDFILHLTLSFNGPIILIISYVNSEISDKKLF